jgi:hypothetical protein
VRCGGAWTGGPETFSVLRASAFAVVAAVETLVRADTTQFGGNAQLAAPGVTGGQLDQDNTQQGPVARVTFSIAFKSYT